MGDGPGDVVDVVVGGAGEDTPVVFGCAGQITPPGVLDVAAVCGSEETSQYLVDFLLGDESVDRAVVPDVWPPPLSTA